WRLDQRRLPDVPGTVAGLGPAIASRLRCRIWTDDARVRLFFFFWRGGGGVNAGSNSSAVPAAFFPFPCFDDCQRSVELRNVQDSVQAIAGRRNLGIGSVLWNGLPSTGSAGGDLQRHTGVDRSGLMHYSRPDRRRIALFHHSTDRSPQARRLRGDARKQGANSE